MESHKVAFFCWESLYAERVGGLASAATNLAETLARQNHEVHFFTRGNIPNQEINGVNYHYCRPSGNNIVEYCDTMSAQMVEQFVKCDTPRFDFLHFHDWHPVQALHTLRDRDTVLTFHSTEYGRNGNQFGDWWEFKEISGKEWYGGLIAKQVTAVSSTMKHEVMHLYNVPDWKCRVIPNGIVPQQYRAEGIDPGEVKKAYGIHPFAPLVLFIGRLVYQKGPDLFIDAVREVCRHRWDAQVIVAGDGGMRQYLESRAKDLPVNFVGYIPDSEYIRLLNACDLVVIPSRNEPFGLVLLEAWSAEKAVVASDVGGLGENIDSFVNGIKTDVTPDSLAWGIRTMLDEPWNAGALGMRGRAKVDRVFLWGPIGRLLTGTYAQIAEPRG